MSNEDFKVKLDVVLIEEVKPNEFNPKNGPDEDEDVEEKYQQVKDSVKEHGLNDAILVREIDGEFEIIDGYHRWRACKELGYEKVVVNNLGKISPEEAKQILLNREKAKVPTDEQKEANLVAELTNSMDLPEMSDKLPYKEQDIEDKLEVSDVDLDDMTIEMGEVGGPSDVSGDKGQKNTNQRDIKSLDLEFGDADWEIVYDALMEPNETTHEQAIVKICKFYLDNK